MKALALVIPFVFVLACEPKSKPPEGGSGAMTGGGSDVTGGGTGGSTGGGGDVECPKPDCGPKLGMPNRKCPDGTVAGPTDRCLRHADGKCGWEVIQCPGGGGAGGTGTAACKPTGCSATICADTDMISTCEYRAEYDCYKTATCARQPSGQCGWTQTDALKSCLASKQGK